MYRNIVVFRLYFNRPKTAKASRRECDTEHQSSTIGDSIFAPEEHTVLWSKYESVTKHLAPIMAPSLNLNNLPADTLTAFSAYDSSLAALLFGCLFGSM